MQLADGNEAIVRQGAASPQLKSLVREASEALALLDANRLEELALCCQALNRELKPGARDGRRRLETEAREALGEMAVFARVLEATRSNVMVMERLRELRLGRLGYETRGETAWRPLGSRYGDH